MRKTGYRPSHGRHPPSSASSTYSTSVVRTALLPAEQSRRPQDQHQRHDDEHDDAGVLRVDALGESLAHPEHKAAHDGAEDRPHAADPPHGEHPDDELGSHVRV